MRTSFLVLLAVLSCLPAAHAQTALNASQDLVRLGIASTNLTPNQPTLDATPLLTKALQYATANGVTLLQVDRGAYYFLTSQNAFVHLGMAQVNGMTIDFQGSDLILSQPAVGGIWLQQSKNAVLENFSLDYAKLPFTQLKVVSVDPTARQIVYAALPNWPDATIFNQTNVATAGGGFYFFIFRNGHPAPDLSRMATAPPFTSMQIQVTNDNLAWTSSAFLARIRPGDTLVLTARGGGDPVQANGCDGCTLRNIKIYSASSWGFQVLNSRNTVVDHVYAIPKPETDRLISTNADGITLSQPGPNNTYRLNRAIRTLDDGLSPHSLLLGVVTGQAPQQVQLKRQFNLAVSNGSPVMFESAADGTILGTATIVSQTPPTPVSSGETVTVVFDRSLPANLTGAVVYTTDPTQRGDNTLLDRNTVQDQVFARGISVWGLVNSALRGNYVWRSAWDAILATHRMVPVDWMSPPLANVTFSQNTIDSADSVYGGNESMGAITIEGAGNPSFQELTASPNANLQITGNFIAQPGLSGVRVESTSAPTVTGNYLVNPNAVPCTNGTPFNSYSSCQTAFSQPVAILNSMAASTSGNTVDTSSIAAYVTDTAFTRLAAFAPATIARVNGYNIGTGPQPAINLTDADGHTWSAAVLTSSTHSLDFRIPMGIGLGGASVMVVSGGSKYVATLFIDGVDNIAAVNGCAYWVGPTATTVAAAGGTIEMLVVTQAGCAFQASSLTSGATVTGGGTATGVVETMIAANTNLPRTVVIEIAGCQIPLAQAGLTNYALSQPATASASLDSARTPDKAVDGNTQTLWSAGVAPPGWIEITLPTNAVVAKVRFTVRVGTPGTVQTVRISARHADGSLTAIKDLTMTNNDFDVVPVPLDARVTGATAIRIDTLQQVPAGFPAWREIEFLSPAAPVITSVTSSTGGGGVVAPNTWLEIHGSNLAPDARAWQGGDFVSGQMPAQLDGVSVTVNGKPAFVEYISSGQVNVLSPLDSTQGPVQVQLKNGSGTSTAYQVTEQSAAPGFFVFGAGPYVAATHADGSYLGPASLYPGTTTPAQPGETIVLYGSGFGQTTPAMVNGAATQVGSLPSLPQVTIGGVASTVQFAGVVSPGLYQINVVVPPSASDGDNTISASYGGSKTQAGLAISVHR
jgi:uncharacterized protein (TIGR03437 family)